jgi:S-adenosylmethionine hydrolase
LTKVGRSRGFAFVLMLVLVLAPVWVNGTAAQQRNTSNQTQAARDILVFMTDFGLLDDAVAICKAVMLRVDPRIRIMDITHQVTPYSILDGARFLAGTSPYYGPGTVFVAVIDPGVGSARKAIVAKSKKGQYFVLPDNGLITLVEDRDGIAEAREITNGAWMIGGKLSSTFHGRDIFSPVGAHLARGEDWTQVGPVIPKLVRVDIASAQITAQGLKAAFIAIDGPYGNLITNVDAEMFAKLGYKPGDKVPIKIGDQAYTLPLAKTFSDVGKNQPLLYIDSRGHLGLAVNQGNAQAAFHVTPPVSISIGRKED